MVCSLVHSSLSQSENILPKELKLALQIAPNSIENDFLQLKTGLSMITLKQEEK